MIIKSISDRQVLRLEELSFNSWPSLRSILYDGWILRLAGGFTNRSNSVWSLYGSNLGLKEKIDRCEHFYTTHDQPTVFRITSDPGRAELDDFLEKLGYSVVTPTIVQTLKISDLPAGALPESISVGGTIDDRWLDDVVDVMDFTGPIQTYRKIVENIVWPLGLFRAQTDGNVIGVALAVAEGEFVGMYGMHTRAASRRKGWGRKLMSAMLQWGRNQGAELAYLHVEADNAPARALYESIGFKEVYRYWYRVKQKD